MSLNRDQFEQRFDNALRARDAGRIDECIGCLTSLLDESHHASAVVAMLGLVLLYEKEDPCAAVTWLRRSVRMSPNSEKASLGLCHALIRLDQLKEAEREAKRFLGLHESLEHRKLLELMTEDQTGSQDGG